MKKSRNLVSPETAARRLQQALARFPDPSEKRLRRTDTKGHLVEALREPLRDVRLDFGSRIELERWRDEAHALFDEIVPPLAGGPSDEPSDEPVDEPSDEPSDQSRAATARASV